jgi:hypothetical protein
MSKLAPVTEAVFNKYHLIEEFSRSSGALIKSHPELLSASYIKYLEQMVRRAFFQFELEHGEDVAFACDVFERLFSPEERAERFVKEQA